MTPTAIKKLQDIAIKNKTVLLRLDLNETQIETIVRENEVVLFMKGTASIPQCGFSSRIAGILNYWKK